MPSEIEEQTIPEALAVARLKRGDLSGLESLVARYQVNAVHAAILVVHDRVLAEEIVQNCFFQTAQKIHQFDDRRAFGPWFLRSVVNAAIQEARRQNRVVSWEGGEDETGSVKDWLIDPALCPENLVENEALYQSVWQALDQLPAHQRAAIVMRYFSDSSEADLTNRFQRPLTTVKWWLYSARQRLRRILQHDYFPEKGEEEVNHE
jgi:RNA polymerase sigma-70 factor (ECF subfamily)